MNKIICDICGTVYPDNAETCPICGYPRQEHEKITTEAQPQTQSVSVDTEQETRTPTHTKGGHYSSKNVKKRLKAQSGEPEKSGSGKGLKIFIILALVAVIGLGMYIGWRYWNGRSGGDETSSTTTAPVETTTQPTETADLSCTMLMISQEMVELNNENPTRKLGVSVLPENTPDEIIFVSSDETVVTVDAEGQMTAVSSGTAIVTVTCGTMSRECFVTCTLEETQPTETSAPEETTQPTETSEATEPSEPDAEGTLELSHTDVTLFSNGETFTITVTYNGEAVSLASVTWTSTNEEIVTVVNGKATATGSGNARIVAEYNGVKAECVVRCAYQEETEPTEPSETTPNTEPTQPGNTSVAGQVINPDEETVRDHNWKPNKTDVTIAVGETFTLRLTNDAGQIASVSWSIGNGAVASMDRFTVMGLAPGTTTLTVTINGTTYSCIVRVK